MIGWGEYDAALHLLSADSIAERTRVFVRRREFDWYGIFEASQCWSRSEQILVQAAFDLWSGGRDLDGRQNVELYEPVHTPDGRTSRG